MTKTLLAVIVASFSLSFVYAEDPFIVHRAYKTKDGRLLVQAGKTFYWGIDQKLFQIKPDEMRFGPHPAFEIEFAGRSSSNGSHIKIAGHEESAILSYGPTESTVLEAGRLAALSSEEVASLQKSIEEKKTSVVQKNGKKTIQHFVKVGEKDGAIYVERTKLGSPKLFSIGAKGSRMEHPINMPLDIVDNEGRKTTVLYVGEKLALTIPEKFSKKIDFTLTKAEQLAVLKEMGVSTDDYLADDFPDPLDIFLLIRQKPKSAQEELFDRLNGLNLPSKPINTPAPGMDDLKKEPENKSSEEEDRGEEKKDLRK